MITVNGFREPILLLILMIFSYAGETFANSDQLLWKRGRPLPDPEGFAGMFGGTSNGALIVGGGANIAGDRWADPMNKVWYDSLFVLVSPSEPWNTRFRLPYRCAYGVSVVVPWGIACLGGGDSGGNFSKCFLLKWERGAVRTSALPDLPKSCAYACGALVENTIYVAGGIETPTAKRALKTFWALDLMAKPLRWRILDPWPGVGRLKAVAGSIQGNFYLFSGAQLKTGPDGKIQSKLLSDAFRYRPGKGWKRIANLPHPTAAAPSPAAQLGQNHLGIFGGADGINDNFMPIQKHPGFSHDVLSYDVLQDSWSSVGIMPASFVTTPLVEWGRRILIPGGEMRPRVRSPQVWSASSSVVP